MSTTEQKALALTLADEQETLLLEVANGERKPGKLPLEPFVRGAAELRRLSAENEALRAQADADNLRHLNHTRMIKGYQDELAELRAQVEALTAELVRKEADLIEWFDKTDWVNKTAKPSEVGKHRADVLRERVQALTKDLADVNDSAAWHKRRTSLLQSLQSTMQEPERTIVCDVLANGHLLQGPDGLPDKQRYATPSPLTRPAVPKCKCTACGAPLEKVVQSANSYLSAEQFDADKLGDWFCENCPKGPNKGSSKHRYFWQHELPTAPIQASEDDK